MKKCKNDEYYTYPMSDEYKGRLKNEYQYVKGLKQYGIYETDFKPSDFDEYRKTENHKVKVNIDANTYFREVLESKDINRNKAKHIIEYLLYDMTSKDENKHCKYPTAEEKIKYLNSMFYSDDKPTDITMFFCKLFEDVGRNGIQAIAESDDTSFTVKVNGGKAIIRKRSPLSFLATKIGVYDSDDTVEDRRYRRIKEGKAEISLNEIENVSETEACVDMQNSIYKDERLNNYIYLPENLKTVMFWLQDKYTHEDIRRLMFKRYGVKVSKSQLRTMIKHIRKQLENPIIAVDTRIKKCCVCDEEKQISEFTKDKSKKDGYSPRCKQCDKERKRKNKNNLVGKMTKTA